MTTTAGNHNHKIDQELFRSALGSFASGITVITGHDEQGPIGFTCQSFYSVSVDPPLVSFSVMKSSTTYPRIRDAGSFTVNVLARDQEAVSNQFAQKGGDKWADIPWSPAAQGNPVLDGALAWWDCTIFAEHDAGDHYIVIGRVTHMGASRSAHAEPLLYFQGSYRELRR